MTGFKTRSIMAAALVIFLAGSLLACKERTTPDPATPNLSTLEQEGLALFILHCAPCHETVSDTVIVGPSLYGIATRAGTRIEGISAENYLRTSILRPYDYIVEGYTETMPPDFGKRLTGEEFDALMAYLLTLEESP